MYIERFPQKNINKYKFQTYTTHSKERTQTNSTYFIIFQIRQRDNSRTNEEDQTAVYKTTSWHESNK